MISRSFKLPDGSTVSLTEWLEGDCTFVPGDGVHDRHTHTIDPDGVQPGSYTPYDGAVCQLASSEEWLIVALVIAQESDVLQPPCWLDLIVSQRSQWKCDVAARLLPIAEPAIEIKLAVPIHIGGTERFRLEQRGEESNLVSVTFKLLRKRPTC